MNLLLVIICSLFATSLALFRTDPDAKRTVIEIIESRHFKAETHEVTTADGYILTIHRIVNPKSSVKNKRPVILQHGLESSSVDWLIDSPDLGIKYSTVSFDGKKVGNNLGFALIMHEYDVWLPNSRGNRYSRKHITLDPDKEDKYWEFSFDQMIKFDLPAVIKYVQKHTKRKTVGYVGHSQGTEIMFGLLSEQPHYSQVVQPVIMLAPVARITHMKSAMKYLNSVPGIKHALQYMGGEFIQFPAAVQKGMSKVCQSDTAVSAICSNAMFLICGFNSHSLNSSRVHVYIKHAAAGTSTQNLLHYLHNWRNGGEFRKFDYGAERNSKMYGTTHPPVYNLKKITSTSIALLYSENDWLADPEDVKFIVEQIGEHKLKMNYKVPNAKWNHLDFIYGLKAAEMVHIKVVELLSHYRHLM